MATFVHAPEVEPTGLRPLRMSAKQLAFHHQDVRTPPTVAPDGTQGASLDHLLAHLESSKQALEHQVQQLLQENRLSKSAKKEQQWQMEGERLHNKLDSMNLSLMEKEERIRHLEKELRDARSSIQQVQSKCKEAENEKARVVLERANLQADLEDAQSNFQNLEREYKLKHDVTEKQRRALESLSAKVEKQRLSFQDQLEDARSRLMESEEKEQKYEHAAQLAGQQLAEKERQLKSLRDAHEKLLAVQKGRQTEERHEVKEVILVLEATQSKCEEQKVVIKELEQELVRIRKEAHQLDTRVAAAEADASSKASALEKVQLELQNTTSHGMLAAKSKAQADEMKAQVETLKRALQDVENTLSEESALRFKAECALNECKVREKSFLKLEQDGKLLQAEVKWRNEQFESLEDAHNKLRDQFHEGLNMWASEKAALLKEIEILTENVQSREIVIHDLLSQVKLTQQSLAHEENCRKLFEFQLADAKAGYDSMSAEYVAAQSVLDNLRDNSKKELAFYKDARDNHLKELHMKQAQIDRDQKELRLLEAEIDRYKTKCEQLQEAGNTEALESGVLNSERERLMKSLADAEATIAKKVVEMKELEMELDRSLTLSELLRTSLSEAEEKLLEGHTDSMKILERVSESLSSKEQHALKLEAELERLHIESERRIQALEDMLRNAHRELQSKSDSRVLDVQDHEEVMLVMRSECEALKRQLSTCELERLALETQRDEVFADHNRRYQLEKQELQSKLEHLGKQCTFKDVQLNDLLDQIEREKHVISTLEARCASTQQELSKQLSVVKQIREELAAEKLNARVHQERAHVLDAALSANAAAKDASLKDIKESLHELTLLCKGGDSATTLTLRISSIEEKLAKQDLLHGTMDGRLGELSAVVNEVERIAQGVAFLNIELNSLKDDSKLSIKDFETRLRAVEGLFTSSFSELQEISELVGKISAERSLLVDIMSKEGDIEVLNREKSSLTSEKSMLLANADALEEKLLKLVKEAESNKAIIDTLNANMKSAKEGAANELHELRGKLKESVNKNTQLVSVADEARGLERQLLEMEAVVHDKEQKLAASEWAVQQLASEIAKSKGYLAQKEKDEALSREHLERLEAELKLKERELMELHCDLENAVKANDEKHALVQQLTSSEDEMGQMLESSNRALEEKTATLAACEAEVKRLLETQKLTEEALQIFKERLSAELETNLAREKEMKRLCADVEKANQAEMDVEALRDRLKCLESAAEARLESCERKMEQGAADLAECQENRENLMDSIEKKDARIEQLEAELAGSHKQLEMQLMQTEIKAKELLSVSEQLQSSMKMLTSLKVELATADALVKELQSQTQRLEERVPSSESSMTVATRDSTEKNLEIEEKRYNVEQLLSQQRDVHSKELQTVTSQLTLLQTALNEAQKAQELVSVKEDEKRVLSLRLSELESLVENGQSHISLLQADLLESRMSLEAETERVWHQVAARNEIETELDSWGSKVSELEDEIIRLQAEVTDCKDVVEHKDTWELRVTSMQSQLEKTQVEVTDWKEVAKKSEFLNAELEKSMQAVKESLVDWEDTITSLADEGDIAKLQMESVLKQVHDEFQTLHADLVNAKDVITITRREGHSLKAELLKETSLAGEEHFESVVLDLGQELSVWKSKALTLQSQLQKWRQRAEEWESFNKVLEQAFVDFEHTLHALGSDAGLSASTDFKLDIQESFRSLRKEVEEAKSELLELKEVAAKESQCARSEFQDSLNSLQAEVVLWKEKSAVATEENLQMKLQFEELLKNLHSELKSWKQFAVEKNLIAETVAKEADELSGVNPINPFHQEDEGCSSSHECDEAASAQLDGLESKTSMSKEGRKLIRQFRASFKHLQSELESQKVAAQPKLAKHSSFVHKHEDTGLESLVRALQEEAVEIRAELADWKRSAQKTASVKEDLERTCSKLKAEVEGWKDRSAMAAGQRIVARRQLDDFAKQVKSLNGELQKWKDVATESNEAASKLQDDLERVQKESEDVKSELSEWMKKALELNCFIKDLEVKSKENSESRVHELEIEVEKWRSVATKAEEEGKVAKLELLDTLGKFEDELEVMSSNSISTNEGRSFKEEDQDNSWQTSGRVEWRHDLEVSLQAEIEDWKTKHAEQEDSRQACDTLIKELRMEVESFKCEDWKKKYAEQEALRQACETTIEELRMEVVSLKCEDWKKKYAEQNALKQACETIIKELRMEVESLKCVVEERKVEMESKTEEMESKTKEMEIETKGMMIKTKELGAELQVWKSRAEYAAEECRALRAAYEDVIKELAQWKEKSETASEECQSMRADLEKALLESAELNMWKSRAADAAEECMSLRDANDNAIKELAQWKEKSRIATEECNSLQAELEKALLDSAELQMWKSRAADAAEDCKSARDAREDLIKELAQWKEKSETATEECQSMRAELEKVVQDLHDQVNLWKEKAEQSLENAVKSQEYEDLIKALEEELCLWAQRTQESKLLQLQMENEQVLLKESLTATENELQRWKDHANAAVSSNRSVQESLKSLTTILEEEEDEVNIDRLSDNEDDKEYKTMRAEGSHHWRARAEHAEHLQLQLEDMLAETQSELKTWKQKATDFSLAAEFLKEELECLIEEGSLDKEDLVRSNHELETQLESSKLALQKWEEKAATITQSTRFLMEEFDMTIEEGELEKQESYASINALKSSLLVWKEKVAEGESLQSELKATLLETETELQEWNEKATVAIATKSELSNRISELEAELQDWKTRAQEGVSVQLQLERALSQMVEEAAVSATDIQALKDELDRTVAESSDQIQELCNAINGLEAELTDVKDSQGTGRNSHLQQQLTETQARLQEWQDKATIAFQAEEELRQAVDEIRAETGKLDNFIHALKDELHEWREKAEHFEVLHHQVTASLASSQEELQRWKHKATKLELAAFEGESVHQTATSNIEEELESANDLARKLTTQLDTQKQYEKSLQRLNRQLESDLVLAREEAFARKQKMTEILSHLEGSRDHQKELQKKLHLAQHRLHANQNLHSQTGTAAKENYTEFNNGRTEDILRSASLKNPAVDKMRQELSSLKSLVSKLGHVRGSDGEQSKSSSVAGDDDAAEEINLRRTASLPSRSEAVMQKQVESSGMAQEGVHPQIMRRGSVEATPSKSRSHKFKVLADVNGKSPRAAVAKLSADPSKHANSSRLLQ